MEEVCERENCWQAYKRVKANKGSPGIDGMKVGELSGYDGKKQRHRDEITRFAAAVSGAEVAFGAISYREWLASWSDLDTELAGHRAAIIERLQP